MPAYVRITGKNEVLEQIEKAQELLEEASRIVYHLPHEIEIEVNTEDGTEGSTTVQDIQ